MYMIASLQISLRFTLGLAVNGICRLEQYAAFP
jgi:hypothetical protein